MAEKTHKPTPKKLRDARKRGEVTKSRELTSLGLFVATLGFLWLGAEFIGEHVISIVERAIVSPGTQTRAEWSWLHEVQSMAVDAIWILAPLLVVAVVSALLIGALQVRGIFSMTPITPKFERISPGTGLKQLFSTRQLFEVGKMLLKTALLMSVLGLSVVVSLDTIIKMVYSPAADLLLIGGKFLVMLMVWAALIYAIGAPIDYWHQFHEFMKQQKMSIDELRRELRETEGDPYIKSRRRSIGRDLATTRMVNKAASASVVIANPTHVSVALYYAPGETDLPRVVAKGIDAVALRIRAEAERNGVPVFEDPPLARWVFRAVDLDQYIGEELIDAIAAVFRRAKLVDRRGRADRLLG